MGIVTEYWPIILAIVVIAGIIIGGKSKKKSGGSGSGSGAVAAGPISVGKANDVWNGQNGSFLFLNRKEQTTHTFLSHKVSNDARNRIMNWCRAASNDVMHMYLTNDGDYGGSGPVNPCPVPFEDKRWGTSLDPQKVQQMKAQAQKAISAGLYPIFWLYADDSHVISRKPRAVLVNLADMLVREFDGFCVGWVIALEAPEHLTNVDTHNAIAQRVRSITQKNVGVHLRKMEHRTKKNYLKYATTYMLQTGFGLSPSTVANYVKEAIKVTGLPVVLVEYHKDSFSNSARALGRAGMQAGAIGTGNGR